MISFSIPTVATDCPSRSMAGSSGYDLKSASHHVLRAGERRRIGTGVRMDIPMGLVGQLRPCEMNSCRMMDVIPTVIDSSFQDEIKVLVHNSTDHIIEIEKGMVIANMVFVRVEYVDFRMVSELGD